MKRDLIKIIRIILIFSLSGLLNCAKSTDDLPAIIPLPNSMSIQDGYFQISASTRILTDHSPQSRQIGAYLADIIRQASGINLNIDESTLKRSLICLTY